MVQLQHESLGNMVLKNPQLLPDPAMEKRVLKSVKFHYIIIISDKDILHHTEGEINLTPVNQAYHSSTVLSIAVSPQSIIWDHHLECAVSSIFEIFNSFAQLPTKNILPIVIFAHSKYRGTRHYSYFKMTVVCCNLLYG